MSKKRLRRYLSGKVAAGKVRREYLRMKQRHQELFDPPEKREKAVPLGSQAPNR